MHWFLLLAPLVALSGLAQIVYAVGNLSRRGRRLVSGLLLLLMLVPVWLLTAQGSVPRASTALLLVPMGTGDLPELRGSAVSTAVVAVGGESGADASEGSEPLAVRWEASGRSRSGAAIPAASVRDDWRRIASAALMPWRTALSHGIAPKPFVAIVDNGSNSLAGISPEQINVSEASGALKERGVTFYRLKVDGEGMGGGRLELAVRGNSEARMLALMSTKIDVALDGCPFAARGDYQLQAWLDPSADSSRAPATFYKNRSESTNQSDPDEFETHVVVGARPVDRRTTRLSLYEFTAQDATKPLEVGFHEVRVELSFHTTVDGVELPLKYRSSTFIEVVDRNLVVFSVAPNANDFFRHRFFRRSWVHRRLDQDPVSEQAVPASAGALLERLLNGTGKLGSNSTRTPFTRATVLTAADQVKEQALANAAALVLVEPTWEELKEMRDVVRKYAARGNSVLVIAPPAQPADDGTALDWLPALADPAKPMVRGDPRIYLLPDASRPASFIALPTDLAATGTALQLKLFNDIAKQLDVYSPYNAARPPAFLVTGTNQRLAVATGVPGVLRTEFEKGWSVVPPVFMRANETTPRTAESYTNSVQGAVTDLAPSWVSARLGLLEEGQRSNWYNTRAMQNAFSAPPPALGTTLPADLDLPLDESSEFPNTCVIVSALDVPQSYDRPDLTIDVWMRQAGSQPGMPSDKLPRFWNVKKLVDGGAKVVVIPIRLDAGYFGPECAYGKNLVDFLRARPGGVHSNLAELAQDTGIVLTDPLTLDASDAQWQAVVKRVLEEVRKTIPNRRRLQWNSEATARAVDRRTITPVDVTFAYRPLRTTDAAKGIDPAATIQAGTENHPVLITMPYDKGAVTVIGFSPFSFDRWLEDRAHVPGKGAGDGWGLQRLIDPVARMTGNIGTGTAIESLRMSDDRRYLQITCRISKDAALHPPIGLPELKPIEHDNVVPPKLLVTVLGHDALSERLEIAVSVPDEKEADGEYEFSWPESGGTSAAPAAGPPVGTHLFIALAGQGGPAGEVRERLDRIAFQTGGAAVDLAQFKSRLESARFDGRFLGTCLLVVLTAVLLSPAARPWSNPLAPLDGLFGRLLGRGRRSSDEEADVDDEADALAALDSGGMSLGQPVAQRPAGPIVQLRQMRPGDSAAAVPASRWILFVPQIADAIGSPPLPQVYETPRPQAMSILTLLDLHAGADAHDSGAPTDRLRVMKRIAMLNAAASIRRGGSHRVTALQAREASEQTEAASPDQVAQRIAALRPTIGKSPAIPELLENELVVFVTDPASMTDDEVLRRLARECGENLCSLTALMLVHPGQVTELGNRFISDPRTLFDRGDLDSSLVERFHADRTEEVAAALGIIESRTVPILSDQSTEAVAKILEEEAWARA